VHKRKLIEVALPLEAINRESAREKSIRHGHPSTLHLWWARRPLAAARAVLFAQLVDDPTARPEEFPTEDLQRAERERLHSLIERLVVWENVRDGDLLREVQEEIRRSTGGSPPQILDPFAGGGTIPLEAQRLGLRAIASDLNPVPVLINKALIEIPPRFAGKSPVFPGLAESQIRSWDGAQGLAADVRAYGDWMLSEARLRIGASYPKIDGYDVIVWVWARSVICPNPACGIEMPLVRSWWLNKKKGKETYVVPSIVASPDDPGGQRVSYEVAQGGTPPIAETMSGRQGGRCVACEAVVSKDYIKSEGTAGRMGAQLLAIVANGPRQRLYFSPTDEHLRCAEVDRPVDVPDQELGKDPRNLWTPQYGLSRFSDLFTNRQLLALTTFGDLVGEARERVVQDGGSSDYADAVATYLGLATRACLLIAEARV
jgi:putative DNA methylase